MKKISYKIELILLISIFYEVFFIFNTITFFENNKSFPVPFFYNKYDSFMDFFNVNWWSFNKNIYTEWHGFYTPLNVYFSQLLVPNKCSGLLSSIALRICSLNESLVFFISISLINFALVLRIVKNNLEGYLWAIFIMLSMPMLFSLERGNYIIATFTIACIYILLDNSKFKTFFLAILINFKLYTSILLLNYYFKFSLKKTIILLFIIISINIIFGFIIDNNQWYRIIGNILYFSQKSSSDGFNQLFVATNFSPWKFSFDNILFIITAKLLNLFIVIRLVIYYKLNIAYIFDCMYMNLILLITLFLFTSAPGYYSLIIIIPFYLTCLASGKISSITKILFILLLLPYPFNVQNTIYHGFNSILFDQYAAYEIGIPIHSYIIPVLLFLIFINLTRHYFSNGEKIASKI